MLVAFIGIRFAVMSGQSLWADEFFSLAMATGHSVEHPAWIADPRLGDYLEPSAPIPASQLARSLEHDDDPAGVRRVARATFLSDTSPPLYYLLLNAWTRLFGSSDAALRSFTVLAAVAAMPLMARLARRFGGRRAILPTLTLYSLAPASVFYSTEGRMYALLWLTAAAQAMATVRLRRVSGAKWRDWALWISLAAGGLLTHYFYVFPLAAFVFWLVIQGRRVARSTVAGALGLVAVAVSPWYVHLPASLSAWRVTIGWLDGRPEWSQSVWVPVRAASRFLSTHDPWTWLDEPLDWPITLVTLTGVLIYGLKSRRRLTLPGLWLASACVGPIVFDLVKDSHTELLLRYSLAGLPAAYLLAGVALTRLPTLPLVCAAAILAASWAPTLRTFATQVSRQNEPYFEAASELGRRLEADDLIVIRSTPAGAAGLARYLEGSALVLPWTEALQRFETAGNLDRAAGGHRRYALAIIHDFDTLEPAVRWLEPRCPRRERWTAPHGTAEIHFCESSSRDPGPGSEPRSVGTSRPVDGESDER